MTSNDSGREERRYTFEQFTAVRRYQPTLSFSPDGSEVAYSVNISGQYNLWRQSSAGGYPHQLTLYSEQAVRDVQWSPDGDWIVYTADHHGDEFHQVYRIPARGGQPEQLTDAPQVQHYLGQDAWSPDGSAIAYSANDRTPAEQDVLVRDMRTGEVRRVYQGDAMYFAAGWSPDGKRLSIVDAKSNTNQDIYVIDPETGEAEHLTPRDGEVKNFPGPWAGDGSGFYVLSDEDREFLGMAFQDLKNGQKRWIETPDWDIEHLAVSPDGRYLIWVVNEGGYSRLYARDLTTSAEVTLPEVPGGVIRHLTTSRDGRKIGILLDRPDHPTEIYVVDIDQQTTTQLTWSFLGGIETSDLIQPESITYPTHDGREIPAFLYKPQGDGPFAVVLSIHGGPEAQERPLYMYSGLYQYWLSRGIGVLAPNVRGSTGYGSTYQKLIHRDWGGAELKDFEAGVHYLHGLDWVDNERIGVFGGSFGGFATLSCVSRLPQYFAAAVDIVGPSNLVTFARAVPPTWRRLMTQWVGDPDTEADFLMERSPITYVDQIRAPLFVIQGAQDPRVVKPESDQIVERLRSRGVEVRYDVYEDEGHGFTKRENEVKAMRDTALFMETYPASSPISYTGSDEGDVAMSTTVSLELSDEQIARLEREAQRLGKSPSDVAARWVEEALREREYPYIEFRDTGMGREAFLKGTRLQIWHLRWQTSFDDDDIPRIAAEFHVTPEAVAEAFAYGRRFADEIEASLAENRHIADNIEQYFPGVRIVEIDATDS